MIQFILIILFLMSLGLIVGSTGIIVEWSILYGIFAVFMVIFCLWYFPLLWLWMMSISPFVLILFMFLFIGVLFIIYKI